jgi:hypothetical protein
LYTEKGETEMKYYVTIQIEEQIEIEADNEHDAVKEALQSFDPTAHDPEITGVWSEDEE